MTGHGGRGKLGKVKTRYVKIIFLYNIFWALALIPYSMYI